MHVDIFKRFAAAFPDCLIIPEHRYDEYFQVTAPYFTWNNKEAPIIPDHVKIKYPNAFCVAATNSETPMLDEGVKQGNILTFEAWWANPHNERIKAAYNA